ncbi:MAG: hypothetical protein ABH859_08660 [Pseudomonadota bacterium]
MKNINKIILVALILGVGLFSANSSVFAKKNNETDGLKKVVAVGRVNTRQLMMAGMNTATLDELLRNRVQKDLEKSGRYVVVVPAETEEEKEESEMPAGPPPKTAAEAQVYAAKMQKAMQKMMAQAQGKYLHKPIAAQALFNFDVQQGESRFGTGTAFDTAEDLTGAPLHSFDLNSDTVSLTLTCIQRDPESGKVLDHYDARTSSTSMRSFRDMMFYTTGDSSDRNRDFDRMFDRAVNKCISWIDKKMEGQTWEGQIIKVTSGQYYINAGSNAGLKEGMQFSVIGRKSVGGKGVELGVEEFEIGVLQVTKVYERYAVTKAISGQPKKGDVIKLMTSN